MTTLLKAGCEIYCFLAAPEKLLSACTAITYAISRNSIGSIASLSSAQYDAIPFLVFLFYHTFPGVTTPCVEHVREILEANGYEPIVFHANGQGGKRLEEMIREGHILAVA
ncbi:MAG: hypothetical protein HFE83_12185, partial [Lachnospiraceae bacterium]|nr:hypothetical protein [Lachnospiraceae bacterium]